MHLLASLKNKFPVWQEGLVYALQEEQPLQIGTM